TGASAVTDTLAERQEVVVDEAEVDQSEEDQKEDRGDKGEFDERSTVIAAQPFSYRHHIDSPVLLDELDVRTARRAAREVEAPCANATVSTRLVRVGVVSDEVHGVQPVRHRRRQRVVDVGGVFLAGVNERRRAAQ